MSLRLALSALLSVATFSVGLTSALACERTLSCSPSTSPPCGPDETPVLIAWPSTCVGFHINERGAEDVPDRSELNALVEQAFATWSLLEGSYLELIPLGETNVHQAGYDQSRGDAGNLNVVMFVEDRWPTIYPPAALALTRVTYSQDGVIFDADIEVNGRFPFRNFAEAPPTGTNVREYDLLSTLVHEVGHLVGLDHTQPETFIGDPADLTLATMHASSGTGQLHKRTLLEDDIACVVDAYPVAAASSAQTCDPIPNRPFHDAIAAESARGWGEFGTLCLDGIDNDSDGLIDCDEPDCDVVLGCTEPSTEPPATRRGGGGCQVAAGPRPTLPLVLFAIVLGWRRRRPAKDAG
jgi:hypothetical protein